MNNIYKYLLGCLFAYRSRFLPTKQCLFFNKTLIIVVVSVFCVAQTFVASYAQPSSGHYTEPQTGVGSSTKISQSNAATSFTQFISGVKYALIELESSEEQKMADANHSPFLDYFVAYLEALGIQKAVYTTPDKNDILQTVPSLCDIVRIKVRSKVYNAFLADHLVEYSSCLGDIFRFTATDTLYKDGFLGDKLLTLWHKMYGKKIQQSNTTRLQLPKRPNKRFNTENILPYLQTSNDEIEGVYEKMLIGATDKTKYEIAIVRNTTDGYDILYLNGASNRDDWQPYENIGIAQPTGSQKLLKVQWYNPDKSLDDNVYLSIGDDGYLYLSFLKNENETYKYFKTFPKISKTTAQTYFSTGTGIAISTDGYIITNNHVVEGGRLFEVQCKIGGTIKNYNAELITTDANSDLAVLKINAPDFKGLGKLPYFFKTGISKMGENVFTLGYPLTNTMGQDIKLTDGIISALTGYQGDPATYQVSVPVQPGNSGGPLFDAGGNLIGIIKAKHAQAANATYAIKSRNVLNLLEAYGIDLILPNSTDLNSQALPEQVSILQDFVFYIKVIQ